MPLKYTKYVTLKAINRFTKCQIAHSFWHFFMFERTKWTKSCKKKTKQQQKKNKELTIIPFNIYGKNVRIHILLFVYGIYKSMQKLDPITEKKCEENLHELSCISLSKWYVN